MVRRDCRWLEGKCSPYDVAVGPGSHVSMVITNTWDWGELTFSIGGRESETMITMGSHEVGQVEFLAPEPGRYPLICLWDDRQETCGTLHVE